MHPVALAQLLEYHAPAIQKKDVLLQMNPLVADGPSGGRPQELSDPLLNRPGLVPRLAAARTARSRQGSKRRSRAPWRLPDRLVGRPHLGDARGLPRLEPGPPVREPLEGDLVGCPRRRTPIRCRSCPGTAPSRPSWTTAGPSRKATHSGRPSSRILRLLAGAAEPDPGAARADERAHDEARCATATSAEATDRGQGHRARAALRLASAAEERSYTDICHPLAGATRRSRASCSSRTRGGCSGATRAAEEKHHRATEDTERLSLRIFLKSAPLGPPRLSGETVASEIEPDQRNDGTVLVDVIIVHRADERARASTHEVPPPDRRQPLDRFAPRRRAPSCEPTCRFRFAAATWMIPCRNCASVPSCPVRCQSPSSASWHSHQYAKL
jgi:hypothetical protein